MTAAELYTQLDPASITDESLLSMFSGIKSYMEGSVYQRLADLGTKAWNSGSLQQARAYYQLSVQLRSDPANMYLLARLYQRMGDTENANKLFDQIVGEHPDSPYAERARGARGY